MDRARLTALGRGNSVENNIGEQDIFPALLRKKRQGWDHRTGRAEDVRM